MVSATASVMTTTGAAAELVLIAKPSQPKKPIVVTVDKATTAPVIATPVTDLNDKKAITSRIASIQGKSVRVSRSLTSYSA